MTEPSERRTQKLGRFLKRAALVFVLSWVALVFLLSDRYVSLLIHPACPASPAQIEGYEPVNLMTASGIPVRGWWRAPLNGSAIILLGGHGANRDSMLPETGLLARHGFGVLTLDYRNCAGRPATLGAREVEEFQAGMEFALAQPGVRQVSVMGFSAGGVAAIRGAARHSQVRAVIAMGNYANLAEEIANAGTPPFSLEWQIERMVVGMLWVRNGDWPSSISPIEDLRRIQPRPVLLIHGEKEAEHNRAQAQLEAAGPAGDLWIVPGAGHGEYLKLASPEFECRVIEFLERSLPPS